MPTVLTYSQAYREGVAEEMAANEKIFIMGTDIVLRGGHFAQVFGLGEQFGASRVRDVPISEAAMLAAGVGSAVCGMRPIVDLNFLDFSFGGMDEICNQAAKMSYMFGIQVPLLIRATNGIALGGAQHNNVIESWFAELPGLNVVTPSNPADVKGLIKSSLRMNDPVLFLMHKALSGLRGNVGGPDDLIPLGHANISRAGHDVTIVTYGVNVAKCLEAAERLAANGIEAEVIDLRTLYPLDRDTVVESVRKTGRAIVVDESAAYGGVSAEIVASIQEAAFDYLDAAVVRITAPHAPVPNSPALLSAILPNSAGIEAAARKLVEVA
ncbi:MAG TPA: transketolase C-terminal domain-containing protein [Acidothermaceae bacterium]|jgi:pyruvate dehydrogenase E1 component beta subunit